MLFRIILKNSLKGNYYKKNILRNFSSSSSSSSDNISISLNDYHQLSDNTLEEIMEKMNVIEDIVEDIDISYSQGVLNLNLGKHGIWVINKQTPNRQIWWSSPVSGPHRFEYHTKDGKSGWYLTRNLSSNQNQNSSSTEIISILSSEMKAVTGKGFD